MKTSVVFALLLVVAVVLASGCEPEPKGAPGAKTWDAKIGGSYKGIMYSGQVEYPGVTRFKVDKKGLSGTYELKDGEAVVKGTLSKFKITGPNKLECKWVDKNGTGTFKVAFKDDLSEFKGTWNLDDNDQWSDWNGKK